MKNYNYDFYKDLAVSCMKNILTVLNDYYYGTLTSEKAYYFIIENLKASHLESVENFDTLDRQIKTMLNML